MSAQQHTHAPRAGRVTQLIGAAQLPLRTNPVPSTPKLNPAPRRSNRVKITPGLASAIRTPCQGAAFA